LDFANGTSYFRHGEKWYEFRSKVQQPMLQPRTAKFYIGTIEDTATSFVNRLANYLVKNITYSKIPDINYINSL